MKKNKGLRLGVMLIYAMMMAYILKFVGEVFLNIVFDYSSVGFSIISVSLITIMIPAIWFWIESYFFVIKELSR